MATAQQAPGRVAVAESDDHPPSPGTAILFAVLLVIAIIVAAVADGGDGFTPRAGTVDVLAGLAIGAFIVDRLVTFVPPVVADPKPRQRATDLTFLRFGWGALFGAVFVALTNLKAVDVLSGGTSNVSDSLDRVIAMLAIAGGVAGLARLLQGINPQPATDATEAPAPGTEPPPSAIARIVGVVLVGVGALIAIFAMGGKEGVNLLGNETGSDGSVDLVVRFGLIFLAAAIVEQLAEFLARWLAIPKNNRAVLTGGATVAFGVAAAWVFDLYLLHNIGFFGTTQGESINDALAASTGAERWADLFFTGLVIGAGTKSLHDLASRLRKTQAKKAVTGTT